MNQENIIRSDHFLELMASSRVSIEALSHEATPIYGDIFRLLEKESKLVNGQIESKVLMCVNQFMSEMKAKSYFREICGNVSAFEIHKNVWFKVQIATENLFNDGFQVDNLRRNKFMLILKSEP